MIPMRKDKRKNLKWRRRTEVIGVLAGELALADVEVGHQEVVMLRRSH
jgi:uncharacterized tellurite resistance protein B-like protein